MKRPKKGPKMGRAPEKPGSSRRGRLRFVLAAVFCVALIVRVVALVDAADHPAFETPITDAATYDGIARALWQDGDVDGDLFFQPLLYPLQLALVYSLTDGSIVAAKGVQAVIGALCCCLVFLVADRRLGRGGALLAAAIAAFYGPAILYEGELLATGSAACAAIALILLFDETDRRRRPWIWAAAGAAGAAAVLLRPTFLPFVLAIAAWQFVHWGRQAGWRRPAAALALGAAAFAAIAVPVAVWNGRVTGRTEFLPASGGMNLFLGNNPDVCRTLSIRPGFEWDRLMAEPARNGYSGPHANRSYFADEVVSYVRSEPVGFVTGLGRKLLQLVSSREIPRTLDVYLWNRWSEIGSLLTWKIGGFGFPFGLLLPAALVGLVFRGRRLGITIPVFLVCYGAAIVLVFVTARYRIPLIPVLAVCAAGGIQAGVEAVRGKQVRRLLIMAAIVAATVAVATLPGPFCEERQDMEADFHFALGGTQFNRGRVDEAWLSFREALAHDPNEAQYHYNFGVASQQRGETDLAERHYGEAIRLDPRYTPARNNLATLMARQGRLSDAIDQYREAIHLTPQSAEPYRNLVRLLLDLRRPREALDVADGLVALATSGPNDLVLRGQAQLLLGDPAAAAESMRRAVAADPDNVEVRLNLGGALLAAGRNAAALEQFERAIELEPRNPGALLRSGLALSELGKFTEARSRLRDAVGLDPGNSNARLALARVLATLGERDAARIELATILKQHPGHRAARELLDQIGPTR